MSILAENPAFRFSASAINLYLRCPRQFYYKHLLYLTTPDHPAAAFGRYLHRLLENLHEWSFKPSNNRPAPAAALAQLDTIEAAVWPEFADKLGPLAQAEARRARGRRIMQEYVFQEFSRKDPPRSTLCETPLVQPFQLGRHYLTGRIDRIDLFDQQAVEIIDYKTGHSSEAENALIKQFLNLSHKPNWRASDYQLPLYYFYWLEHSGQPPRALAHYHLRADTGVRLVKIEVRPGPTSAAEQKNDRRKVLYADDMAQVRDELIRLLDDITNSAEFEPRPPKGLRECARCPFAFACEGPGRLDGEELP